MPNETLEAKIARVTAEKVEIVAYNPAWPHSFAAERDHLVSCLPADFITEIHHFGSTSVPGMAAKPVIDMLIRITDAEKGRTLIPSVLEPQGYDCFWRPLGDTMEPPFYTWCIGRNHTGTRTHHLHFVEGDFLDKDITFRDILRSSGDVASKYRTLKLELASKHKNDRIAYTQAKGAFIRNVLNHKA